MRKAPRWHGVVWYLVSILILLVMLFPIYWMFVTAILPTSDVLSRNPALIPIGKPFTFDAFVHLFTESAILKWLMQSGIVFTAT